MIPDWALALASTYKPELFVQTTVQLACWVIGLMFDYLGPVSMPDRTTRRWVFILCFPVAFLISMVLWAAVDNDNDRYAVRVIISAVGAALGGVLAPFVHRTVTALIKWKWPDAPIASAFSSGEQ